MCHPIHTDLLLSDGGHGLDHDFHVRVVPANNRYVESEAAEGASLTLHIGSVTHIGSARDRIDKLKSYFHLMAWSLPLVLTITIMAMSEVDGNSMTGICFVGYRNAMTRFSFILLPVGVMSLVSFFFTIRGILQLLGMRSTASTGGESKKIHAIILNMGIRMMFLLLCIVGFFVFQLYEFRNTASWAEHLHELIM